jgi:hypothetical protein
MVSTNLAGLLSFVTREDLARFGVRSMGPGDAYRLDICVLGAIDEHTSQLVFTIGKAGRILNAVWVIDVPR